MHVQTQERVIELRRGASVKLRMEFGRVEVPLTIQLNEGEKPCARRVAVGLRDVPESFRYASNGSARCETSAEVSARLGALQEKGAADR